MEISSLAQRDRQTIWHPFTQMQTSTLPICIQGGRGAYLIGEDEKHYLDAFSSWWVNLHGHCHPYMIDALQKQATQLEHLPFTDFTHQPAVELGERLLHLLPKGFSKVFYSDNGSTAVETALKMVFQYWFNQDPQTKKQGIISFKDAYHGDTFGAMSVAGRGIFNQPFWPFLFDVIAIDPPSLGREEESFKQLQEVIDGHDIAGFIFEPHIQGIGGMKVHSLKGLDVLIGYCKQKGILTIVDEVMTGFGRTGALFVSQHLQHVPDIICLAKGLTGGMLPLSVTICSQKIYDAFLSEDRRKALLHGHSYYANPLACAVALASLDLLEETSCQNKRLFIESQHRAFCRQWQGHPCLKRLEQVGTILIVEYQNSKESSYFDALSSRLKQFFLERGILIRPFGNTLHIMPPYCVEEEDLEHIYHTIIETWENLL